MRSSYQEEDKALPETNEDSTEETNQTPAIYNVSEQGLYARQRSVSTVPNKDVLGYALLMLHGRVKTQLMIATRHCTNANHVPVIVPPLLQTEKDAGEESIKHLTEHLGLQKGRHFAAILVEANYSCVGSNEPNWALLRYIKENLKYDHLFIVTANESCQKAIRQDDDFKNSMDNTSYIGFSNHLKLKKRFHDNENRKSSLPTHDSESNFGKY